LKGLSPVMGNYHAGFFGGLGSAMTPGYPVLSIFGFLKDSHKFYLPKFWIDPFDISIEIHGELFELKADLLKAKKKKRNGGLKRMQNC
jgi:hypothetical protein